LIEKFLDDILAVLALPRGNQSMYLGMMNCMKPQCRYTRPLLPLETGIRLLVFFVGNIIVINSPF